MSDWLERFKSKEETQTAEELEADFPDDDDIEDDEFQDQPLKELQTFDMDLDELVADISKTNGYIFASLKAMNEELKAGFTLVRSEQSKIADVNEIMISLNNIADRVDALEEKVIQSLLAMEDGNEKRALLLANALEEINDLVADPDGMTDVFKVAPDIAMGAIEREAQGELSDEKPFDPDDEIYLPEETPNELTMEEEWAAKIKIADMVDEEHPTLLHGEEEEFLQQKYPHLTLQEAIAAEEEMQTLSNKDYDPYMEHMSDNEGGAGEIQSFSLPEELAEQGYTEESYNKVMDYINGDIKWKDIVKYAGGMKQAKALVDPVKASLDML